MDDKDIEKMEKAYEKLLVEGGGEEGKVGADIFKIVSGKLQGKLSEQIVNRIKFSVLPRKKFGL